MHFQQAVLYVKQHNAEEAKQCPSSAQTEVCRSSRRSSRFWSKIRRISEPKTANAASTTTTATATATSNTATLTPSQTKQIWWRQLLISQSGLAQRGPGVTRF